MFEPTAGREPHFDRADHTIGVAWPLDQYAERAPVVQAVAWPDPPL